jgi:hypothetical protein
MVHIEVGRNSVPKVGRTPVPPTVSVPSTIAELESPLHFDAMIARNTSGYIAVGVGIWPGKPPQVSPLLTVGTPQVARNNYSDAMLFPIVTGSRAVKSGLAVVCQDKLPLELTGDIAALSAR